MSILSPHQLTTHRGVTDPSHEHNIREQTTLCQQTKEVQIPHRLFTQIFILTLLNQGRIGVTEELEG